MERSIIRRRIGIGVLLIVGAGVLGQNGCPSPTPTPTPSQTAPTILGAGVSGNLVQGQPSIVEVTATVSDDGTVAAVTANLTRIGGSQSQPLVLDEENIWRFTGTVTPPNSGQQRVTVTATDDQTLGSQVTVTVNVAGGDPSQQVPVISDAAVTGPLIVGQTTTITVTATVTPGGNDVIAVIADLSEIGGFTDTPLLLTTGNLWSFTGVVTPLVAGTRSIVIEATDSSASTATATTAVVVESQLGF